MRKLAVLILIALLAFPLFSVPATVRSSSLYSFATGSYQLSGGIVDKSSPTLADLDGDGVPEVLVGTTAYNGILHNYSSSTYLVAMRGDGSLQFQVNVGAPINSAPAVADIDGDGEPEVVVSVGGDVVDLNHHGGIRAFDRFGNNLWSFNTYDRDGNDYADGVYSSPTLCDVDSDGDMEIIFGSWDQRIYMLDHNGNSLWNNLPQGYTGRGYLVGDSTWSTAACVDLDRDGYKEIIIGADITGGGTLPGGSGTEDGGFLYVFDKDGNVLVRRFLPETVYAAPAVGDLDADGDYEIVVGTGWYWWNAHGRTDQPYVHAFDTSHVFDSHLDQSDPARLPYLPGWPRPTDYPGFSSPALADLDEDGDLEVVIGTSHPDLNNDGILGAGSVYAWHHTGQTLPGWPIHPQNWDGNDAPIFSSPTIADVDGDGGLEVLFSMLWDVYVYNVDGSLQDTLETNWTVWGSPAVGDADGDGRPEIWIGGSNHLNPSRGYLWRFELNTQATISAPWPMFHRNPQNTRYYSAPPRLSVLPTSLLLMHEYGSGSSESANLWIASGGDEEIEWQVDTHPPAVTVAPLSGTVDWTGQSVNVTVSTAGYQTGTYSIGNVVITGAVEGEAVDGSPAIIPITLYVGRVHRLFIPLVSRASP